MSESNAFSNIVIHHARVWINIKGNNIFSNSFLDCGYAITLLVISNIWHPLFILWNHLFSDKGSLSATLHVFKESVFLWLIHSPQGIVPLLYVEMIHKLNLTRPSSLIMSSSYSPFHSITMLWMVMMMKDNGPLVFSGL